MTVVVSDVVDVFGFFMSVTCTSQNLNHGITCQTLTARLTFLLYLPGPLLWFSLEYAALFMS